jgi:hypothetical protein
MLDKIMFCVGAGSMTIYVPAMLGDYTLMLRPGWHHRNKLVCPAATLHVCVRLPEALSRLTVIRLLKTTKIKFELRFHIV